MRDLGALVGSDVAQVPRVVSGTIAENLDLDRDTGSALRAAQLEDDVTWSGGTGTLIGHNGLRLPGGQTQGRALARALTVQADFVVLDDVSSALDASTEADLWNALARAGATIIVATSREATLRRADQVFVLHSGRQVDAGVWRAL